MNTGLKRTPVFKTKGQPPDVRLFLHCSQCDAEMREVADDEAVDVRVAHYCKQCDPGGPLLNLPDTVQ